MNQGIVDWMEGRLRATAKAWGVTPDAAARVLSGREHSEFWKNINADEFLNMRQGGGMTKTVDDSCSAGFGSPEHVAQLREGIESSQSGWGGMLPGGQIVDRREHPEAIPIAKNSMFGVPQHKEVLNMERVEVKQALKENVIRLVAHHKEHCDGENCNISLHQVRMLIEAAGITLSNDEKRMYIVRPTANTDKEGHEQA